MNEHETAVGTWLKDNGDAMVALLEEIVNIDGGSYDKAGVDAVGEVLRRFLSEHGVSSEIIPVETLDEALEVLARLGGEVDALDEYTAALGNS